MNTIAAQLVTALSNNHVNVGYDPDNTRVDAHVLVRQCGDQVVADRFARAKITMSNDSAITLIGKLNCMPQSDNASMAFAAMDLFGN